MQQDHTNPSPNKVFSRSTNRGVVKLWLICECHRTNQMRLENKRFVILIDFVNWHPAQFELKNHQARLLVRLRVTAYSVVHSVMVRGLDGTRCLNGMLGFGGFDWCTVDSGSHFAERIFRSSFGEKFWWGLGTLLFVNWGNIRLLSFEAHKPTRFSHLDRLCGGDWHIWLTTVDLGQWEKRVEGEIHLTLTGWDRKDYSFLKSRRDIVVLQMANSEVVVQAEGSKMLKEIDLNDTAVTDDLPILAAQSQTCGRYDCVEPRSATRRS